MASIIFILNKQQSVIKCLYDDYMEEICKKFEREIKIQTDKIIYLYRGNKINPQVKLIDQINKTDKKRNLMTIICIKIKKENIKKKEKDIILSEEFFESLENSYNNYKLKTKEIICPECGEACKIKFEDLKISFYDCKNGHKKDNVDLEKFEETQKNNQKQVFCDKCKNKEDEPLFNNDKLFECLTCNNHLCIKCYENHNKEHNLVNFEQSKFICKIHNKKFVSFCNKCKLDLCSICENDHKNENELIFYRNMITNINNNEKNEFYYKIKKLNKDINEIIQLLTKIMNKIKIYYKIYFSFVDKFDINNSNYLVLKNVNEIMNYFKKLMNGITKIIEEGEIKSKINNIINIFQKSFENRENIIKYKTKNSDTYIKIFGKKFVINNKNNCKIVCNKKEFDLTEYFDISNYANENNILEIELKIINNIKDMSFMFDNCSSLFFLSSNFDTKDVINMSYIFNNCFSLTNLYGMEKWKSDNVNNMEGMFNNCIKISNLPDISKWNINKVINLSKMFNNCTSLNKLPNISKWNTNQVKILSKMFNNCTALNNLPDISKWDISNTITLSYLFSNCISLTELPDISKWNTKEITNIEYLFNGCSSLISLPNIGKWDLTKVQYIDYLFYNCSSLINIPDISNWNISNAYNLYL